MSVQMSDVRKTPSRMQQIIELLFSIFLRLLAIVFFAAAIYIWMTAIGYWEGANYRFDTMGVALKIYTAIMAVMLPVAWTATPPKASTALACAAAASAPGPMHRSAARGWAVRRFDSPVGPGRTRSFCGA